MKLVWKNFERFMRVFDIPYMQDNYSYLVTKQYLGFLIDPGGWFLFLLFLNNFEFYEFLSSYY